MTEKNLPAPVAEPMELHLFATKPAELARGQREMVKWVARRISEIAADLREATENLAVAKTRKWRMAPWRARCSRLRAEILYYQKIKEALMAGYWLMPPLPIQAFAVRTKRKWPRRQAEQKQPYWLRNEQAERLPPGEGRYVAPEQMATWRTVVSRDAEGKEHKEKLWQVDEFRPFTLPTTLVKPEILGAISKAEARKLFDDLGIVSADGSASRGRDPIVCGRILHPNPHREPATFFIAWWLRFEDI